MRNTRNTPGSTATEENISNIGKYLNRTCKSVIEKWELCAFNPLATEKYSRLNLDWKYEKTALYSTAGFEKIVAIAEKTARSIRESLLIGTDS